MLQRERLNTRCDSLQRPRVVLGRVAGFAGRAQVGGPIRAALAQRFDVTIEIGCIGG